MPAEVGQALVYGPQDVELRSHRGIDNALAKVLSYGHHHYFSQVSSEVPKLKRWSRNAKQEVMDILEDKSDARVVVPESYTALVKHDTEPKMYVIHHGAFIGELGLKAGKAGSRTLVLVSDHGKEYAEGTERSLVMEGLAQLGRRLFNCEVISNE